jgi:hypothetical protein
MPQRHIPPQESPATAVAASMTIVGPPAHVAKPLPTASRCSSTTYGCGLAQPCLCCPSPPPAPTSPARRWPAGKPPPSPLFSGVRRKGTGTPPVSLSLCVNGKQAYLGSRSHASAPLGTCLGAPLGGASIKLGFELSWILNFRFCFKSSKFHISC